MKTLKYAVIFVLAALALGMVASGLGAGLNDKTLAVAGTPGSPGISMLTVKTPGPNYGQCVASCAKTFQDKNSFQYKACVKGC